MPSRCFRAPGEALPGVEELCPVGAEAGGGGVEGFRGEAGELAALLLKEEQGGALFVPVPAPIGVEGQLVQHLVVPLLFLLRQQGLFGGGLHSVGLGEPQVPVCPQQGAALAQGGHRRSGKGHRKGLDRLAAPGVQPVESGVVLPGLPLLFPVAPVRGEEQGVSILPQVGAHLAVPGKAQGGLPLFQQPQVPAVGVLLPAGLGAEEGQVLPRRRGL